MKPDPMKREPVLTDIERQSAVWQKIKAHLEGRLLNLRIKNDGDKDPEMTAKLRGRIAEVKHLAALDNPAPQTEADDFPD